MACLDRQFKMTTEQQIRIATTYTLAYILYVCMQNIRIHSVPCTVDPHLSELHLSHGSDYLDTKFSRDSHLHVSFFGLGGI